MESLETSMLQVDFSQEAEEMGTGKESIQGISGKGPSSDPETARHGMDRNRR